MPMTSTGSDQIPRETYISVDVETSGPFPPDYSLLSIGACLVIDPGQSFYCEIQPLSDKFIPSALEIGGLSLDALKVSGTPPKDAMDAFSRWVKEVTPPETQPVFVGFNAPFDWMFVHYYFWRFTGQNPFGHSAIDIKAYLMGLSGCTWTETSMRHVSPRYLQGQPLSHNALDDAVVQASIFSALLAEARLKKQVPLLTNLSPEG